jgi:GNAT superfamily N-acetyltransferase
MSAVLPDLRLPFRRGPVEFSCGSEADHESVYLTLLHVFQGPDRDTFLGVLSDPDYKPEQRLLVKVDGRIASHVHLTERLIHFHGHTLPINGVMWVGTLPEYRGLGFAQNLMRLASTRARQTGRLLQTATTNSPQFYEPLGWAVCGRYSFGVVASRNLPAGAEGVPDARAGAWHVRPWRQVELGDLMRLYEQQFGKVSGALVRSEEYWRWLIGRRFAHAIWVACQGEKVFGYAFVKDHRVLEIAADNEHPLALQALLGRVRSEALERAYPEVLIHAHPHHPVLHIVEEGGGAAVEREEWDGNLSMYHIPDVAPFLTLMLPEFQKRARAAKVSLPYDLGLVIGESRWLIHIAKGRGSSVEPDRLSRRYLTLTPGTFVRLALGHTEVDRAIDSEDAVASSSTAVDAARVLFPPSELWRSPLDSITA